MAKQIAEQLKYYIDKIRVSTLKRQKIESTELNVNQPIHKQKLNIGLS